MTGLIDGDGTPEATWWQWLAGRDWPQLDLARFAGRRVVVLAAHPDDEVLGAAGLMQQLAAAGSPMVYVWATDGEASHPRSAVFTRSALASRRRAESQEALRRLGLAADHCLHLGLPDGEVGKHVDELATRLRTVAGVDSLLVAPWRHDGHPDHEAVGRVAALLDLPLIEYPVWMWHWAQPDDRSVPWHRARVVTGVDPAVKAHAIEAFVTQIEPIGPGPQDAAVLPPHVLDRFRRPIELVLQ